MLPIIIFTLTVFLGGGKLLWQFSIVALTILLSYILLLHRDTADARSILSSPNGGLEISLLLLLWSIIVIFTTKCLYSHLKNTLQIVVYIMFFLLSLNYCNYKLTIVVIPILGIIQSCIVLLQRIFHYTPYGLFPYNPNFVSGFVASITLFSIGYLLFYRDELQSSLLLLGEGSPCEIVRPPMAVGFHEVKGEVSNSLSSLGEGRGEASNKLRNPTWNFKLVQLVRAILRGEWNTVGSNFTPLEGCAAKSNPMTSNGIKIIMIVSVILGLVTVFLGSSRSVIIGFVLCLGYYMCRKFKFKGFVVYSLLIVLVVAAFGDMIFTKYVKLYDPFAFYRLKLWNSAIRMTMDYPIYGVGLGNYGRFFPRYNFPVPEEVIRFSRYTDFAHNEYLQVASELGLLGLIFVLLIICNVLKTVYPVRTKSFGPSKPETRSGSNGIYRNSCIFIPVLLLLFQAFFDLNLHLPANVFLIALFVASSHDKNHKLLLLPKIQSNRFFTFLRMIISICILLLCSFYTFNLVAEIFASKKKYLLATKFNPINPEYYYLAQKDLDITSERKIELLKKSILFDNENYRYHLELGCLYLGQDFLKYAIRELKLAIEKNPFNVTGYFYLGKLHLQMKEYSRSQEYFYKCIILEPKFSPAKYFLSKCSEKAGSYRRAKSQ